MTTLLPLKAADFDDFRSSASASYAEQNVAAGRWPAQDAQAMAESEMRQMLPDAQQTPGHFVFAIGAEGMRQPVGYLWYATAMRGSAKVAYVYQVLVKPAFQRQGHARAALIQAERHALAGGHDSMALNVFVQNTGAQALYRSLGYGVTNMNMAKALVTPPLAV